MAALILRAVGIHDVEIVEHDESLGDHYDPMHKRLMLSSQNYHTSSAAALGVAAHESCHAILHQIAYASSDIPIHHRVAAAPSYSANESSDYLYLMLSTSTLPL